MSPKSNTRRRLAVESLESRAMLAGNVTVAVTDNFLRIVGDNLANDIEIRHVQQTYEGEWPGTKLQVIGRSGTTINGQATSHIAEGVKTGVFIGLQGGDNRLQIGVTTDGPPEAKPVPLPGQVTIGTWNGNDSMQLSISNGMRVTVNTGPGNDGFFTSRSKFNVLTVNSDPIPAPGQPAVGGNDNVVLRR